MVSQSNNFHTADCTYLPPDSTFPLPVQLSSFSGSLINKLISLNWKTANEANSFGYDIERSKQNATWEKIGFVASHGTTTAVQDYIFVDKNPPVALELFYRLKMVDLDGSYRYSQTLKIPVSALPCSPELYAVYPNPAQATAVIHFSLPRDAVVSIAVYDAAGNEVRRLCRNEALNAGEYSSTMNLAGLANGNYFVRMSAGDFMQTQNLVLQR